MDVDKVKQIVETIKTLNINFNDATTQKIAEAVLPAVRFYLVKELLVSLAWVGAIVLIAVLSYKLFILMVNADKEKKFKEEERKMKIGDDDD